MGNYERKYPGFSLCGLNCRLCTMYHTKYCPGCGGGAGNQTCALMRCGREHGEIECCCECEAYPCEKYDGIDTYDSFITHLNQKKDLDKWKRIGAAAYQKELEEKEEVLRYLVANYNDGRRKTLLHLAVNLLELEDVKKIIEKVEAEINQESPVREKAAAIVRLFQEKAKEQDIVLKIRKKK